MKNKYRHNNCECGGRMVREAKYSEGEYTRVWACNNCRNEVAIRQVVTKVGQITPSQETALKAMEAFLVTRLDLSNSQIEAGMVPEFSNSVSLSDRGEILANIRLCWAVRDGTLGGDTTITWTGIIGRAGGLRAYTKGQTLKGTEARQNYETGYYGKYW